MNESVAEFRAGWGSRRQEEVSGLQACDPCVPLWLLASLLLGHGDGRGSALLCAPAMELCLAQAHSRGGGQPCIKTMHQDISVLLCVMYVRYFVTEKKK